MNSGSDGYRIFEPDFDRDDDLRDPDELNDDFNGGTAIPNATP